MLSIEEAAVYFRIGENRLRRLISENEHAKWLVRVGNRILIIRQLFEQFLVDVEAI